MGKVEQVINKFSLTKKRMNDKGADDIHIVLACDEGYAPYAMVLIQSILDNTSQIHKIYFHILTESLSDKWQEAFEGLVKSRQAQVLVHIMQKIDTGFYVNGHLSRAAYYRLLIGSLLPESIQRCIYLDCDLVVLDDIAILWDYFLEEKTLGAVPDYGILSSKRSMDEKRKVLGLHVGDSYFNSGVLLFDLQKWRDKGYEKKAMQEAQVHTYRHNDQDILNHILYKDWQVLPLEWNVIPPLFLLGFKILGNRILRHVTSDLGAPKILHWAGSKKPWQFRERRGFNGWYYVYAKRVKMSIADGEGGLKELSIHKRVESWLARKFYKQLKV